ncbi:MAG: nucleoside recognition protein [Methanotrichaceae archaeon]|nr:nucleoside recognition protein [Methanotrichaceae archaeon]
MLNLLLSTIDFAIPVLITIFFGLFFAGLIVEMGLLYRVSHLSRPLVSLAHLPEIAASSFVVSLGSTVAANGMIARFRNDNFMESKEVFLCASINGIPAYIREIFTYQIPIVLPTLGLVAGSIYASIFMVTALLKFSLVILLGRLLLKERSYRLEEQSPQRMLPFRDAIRNVLKSQIKLFSRIATIYLVMTFIVFALRDIGVFEQLSQLPVANLFSIPPQSIIPMTTYVASPVMGLSMLGPMISNGSITNLQALVILMLGSMLMLPLFALRSLVPNYTAIFGPRLGLSVVVFSTGLSMLVRLAFLMTFLRLA